MLRAFVLLIGLSMALPLLGQRKNTYRPNPIPKRPTENERFLQTQWWLGFKAGASTTAADPDMSFNGFSPLNYEPQDKQYDDFKSINGHAGLEITLYHKGFSFSFQPNYRRQSFQYANNFEWVDSSNPNNSLTLNYQQDHQLDYIEFPVFIKYDILKTPLRPFIQVGAYYATLVNAQKSVEISGTDYASGYIGPFQDQTLILGVDDQFIKSSVGVAGGVGVSYDLWNIRIILDGTYRYGLNNITNAKNRYSSNQLASIGDALDDIKLKNIAISLGCVFPLRFINRSYQSTN